LEVGEEEGRFDRDCEGCDKILESRWEIDGFILAMSCISK
jgi:hypothetical protein